MGGVGSGSSGSKGHHVLVGAPGHVVDKVKYDMQGFVFRFVVFFLLLIKPKK